MAHFGRATCPVQLISAPWPGVIDIRDKRYKSLMYCHQYYFCGKYDLIQLHRQILQKIVGISAWKIHWNYHHQPFFRLKSKENNENDMAAHEIYFDFLPCRQPSKTEQNGCRAAADAHPTGVSKVLSHCNFNSPQGTIVRCV